MKKLLFVGVMLWCASPLLAQRQHQHHIGTQAHGASSDDHHIVWTVGEVVTLLPPEGTHHVTHGFLQTRVVLVSAEEHTEEPVIVHLYPNPARDEVHIEWSGISGSLELDIYDLSGQLIKSSTLENQNQVVEVSELEVGMYLFTVKDSNHQSLKTFKIHKTL